jgi:Uma2 family endonuclease
MTLATPRASATPDDVLALENEALFELVHGRLVEKKMSSEANEVAGIIGGLLYDHRRATGAGKHYPQQTFQCFPHDPTLVRRPDISFVATARLAGVEKTGHVTIAPDLAIEVVSPNDKIYELDEKLDDYRKAGVKLVWIVDPKARTVRVRPLTGPTIELEETDILKGEPVLPGFAVAVSGLFPKS